MGPLGLTPLRGTSHAKLGRQGPLVGAGWWLVLASVLLITQSAAWDSHWPALAALCLHWDTALITGAGAPPEPDSQLAMRGGRGWGQ